MSIPTAKKIKDWLSKNKGLLLICLAIFTIAFLPRIINLEGHALFTDEGGWQGRSRILWQALGDGNIDLLRKGWWKFNDTIAIGIPASLLMGLSINLLKSKSLIFASRLPITIIGSLTPVFFYLLLSRLKRPRIGLVGALFLALEPIFVGMSRWAHQDAILTFFFLISLGAYYLGEKEDRFSYKIVSAVFFAFAFVTKLNAMAIPLIILAWKTKLYLTNKQEKSFKPFKLKELSLPVYSFVVIVALWPALWGNAFYVLNSYITQQATTISSYDHLNLFMGQITTRPGLLYYPVILLIRLSPLAILALILAGATFFIKGRKGALADFWWLNFLWMLIYLIVMSLSPKKLEVRYVLAIWPALAFFISYGLINGLKLIPALTKKNVAAAVAGGLIVAYQVPVLFVYNPNYYLYYNSLIGGPGGAQKSKITLVGSGDAKKALAIYMAKHFSGKKISIVHFGHVNPFLAYLPKNMRGMVSCNIALTKDGKKIRNINYNNINKIYSRNVDFIILEENWVDRGLAPSIKQVLDTDEYELIYTYRSAGVDLGWIFINKSKKSNLRKG